jgi:hypothetical protein
MRSESKSERGGNGADETAAVPVATASDALERQLRDALDADDGERTQFHLRQALQLVEAFDE